MWGCSLAAFIVDPDPCAMTEPVAVAAPKRGKNFRPSESALLATFWLAVSCDPVNGADQQADTYWKKIVVLYNAEKPPSDPERTQQALQCHWTQVQRCVSKFAGFFNRIMNELPSGWNEENAIDESLQRYKDSEKKDFKFMESFKVLRKSPKFGPVEATAGLVRNRESAEGEKGIFVSPPLPEGAKRAKLYKDSGRDAQRAEIQAAAASMAAGQLAKNALIKEQNTLLQEKNNLKLFMGTPEGEEYLRLLRMEKLAELQRRVLPQ